MSVKLNFLTTFVAVTQTTFDMISIIARNASGGDVCTLTAYIKNRQLGINTYISIKVKIPVKEWNADMQLPRRLTDERRVSELNGMSYAELASKIIALKKELAAMEDCQTLTVYDAKETIKRIMNEDYYKEVERRQEEETRKAEEAHRVTLMGYIEEFIRQCETGERLKRKSTRKITPGTIKSYRGTLEQLRAYQLSRHKTIDFDDVTLDFYEDWKQFFIRKNYSPNTIGRHVRNLKIFMFAADDEKLTTSQEFKSSRFSADREDVDNVYLSDERVQQLYEFNPTDRERLERQISQAPLSEQAVLRELTEKVTSRQLLEEAKDVFVVGCLTGQRVSDYKRINESMLATLRDGRQYIRLEQEKTGKEVFLPIDPRVPQILKKYGGSLPKTYDQHLNERIKIVGRLLGWTEPAGITEHRGLMEVRSQKKFYECIKTHTARRTFATNAYMRGVSLSSIMAVTGHSSEQMLRKYLKLDNKERAILAAAEFAKII